LNPAKVLAEKVEATLLGRTVRRVVMYTSSVGSAGVCPLLFFLTSSGVMLCLMSQLLLLGCCCCLLLVLQVKPIGVLGMLDQGERDDKIIAVHSHDPAYKNFNDISE
jgi:hypothetical protein